MAKPKAAEKPPKPEDVDSNSDSSDDEDYVPDDKADALSEGDDDMDDNSDTEQPGYHDGEEGEEFTTTRSGKRRANGSFKDNSHLKPRPEDTIDHAEAARKKSKLDALWAELNTPVSKPTSRPELLASAAAATAAAGGAGSGAGGAATSGSGKMVTITTTYDFAGETVTVTKDVPEDSKEARDFAAKNNKTSDGSNSQQPTKDITSIAIPAPSSTSVSTLGTAASDSILSTAVNLITDPLESSLSSPSSDSTTTTLSTPGAASPSSSSGPRITTRPSMLDSLAQKTKAPVRYVRKKSTLDELAATYGVKKPPKMNTLEKSKLDWKNFVGKEGIEDELKHHNKDGYMEKVAFLQRTDERRDREYQALKKKK